MTRRLAKRALFALTLLVVAALSLHVTLRSGRFAELIVDRVKVALERQLDARLEVGRLELEPLLLRVTLDDVELRAATAEGTCSRIIAYLDLGALVRRQVRVTSIRVVGARAVLDQRSVDALGARLAQQRPGATPIFDAFEIADSSVDLQLDAVRLELRSLTMQATRSGERLDLTVVSDVPTLTVGDRPLAPATFAVDVELAGDEVTIQSLDLTLRASRFVASGSARVDRSSLDVNVDAEIDLANLTSLVGRPGFAEGPVRLGGRVSGDASGARFAGRVDAPQLTVDELSLSSLSGDVTISSAGVSVSGASVDLLQGQLRFDARLPRSPVDSRIVDFQAAHIDIERLSNWLPALPVVAGTITARGTARLASDRDEPRLDATMELVAVEPALRYSVADARIYRTLGPLDVAARVTWVGDVVRVVRADVLGPWYVASAFGTVGTDGAADLCIEMSDADARAITRLDASPMPWRQGESGYWLTGPFEGSMTWKGTMRNPIIQADLYAPDLDLHHEDGARLPIEDTQVHIEYAEPLLTYDGTTTSDSAGGVVDVTGTLRFDDNGTVRHLVVRGPSLDAASVADLIALPTSATGRVALAAEMTSIGESGWSSELHIDGGGTLAGIQARRLAVALSSDTDRTVFHDLTLEVEDGKILLTGVRDRVHGTLELDITTTDVPVQSLPSVPEATVTGLVNGAVRVSGPADEWRAEGDLRITDLHFKSTSLNDATGTLLATPDLIRLELSSGSNQDLWVDILTTGEMPFRTTASFEALPLAPLISLLLPPGLLDASGEATGAVVISGNLLSDPRVEKATLEISAAVLKFRDFELAAGQPWRIALDRSNRLHLSDLVLTHEQERLEVAGVIGLKDQETSLSIDGTTDLRSVRAFFPTISATGPMALEVEISGPLGLLRLDGEAALTRGYLYSRSLPYPLREVEARADFDGRQIRLDVPSARFGGGQLRADGVVDLDGPDGPQLLAHASGRGVRFTMFEDLDVRADPELTYLVSMRQRRLSGLMPVTRAVYKLEGQLGSGSGTSLDSSDRALSGFPETDLDLTVVAPSNLWLKAANVELEGDARLQITGTTADPSVRGSVRYLSQKEFEIEGRSYQVVRATLTFENPTSLDPILDFEAESSVQGFDVAVRASGPLSQPQVSVSSIPPLTEGEALSLLIGGRAQEESGVAAPTGSQEILYQLLLPRAFSRLVGPNVTVAPTIVRGRTDPTEVIPISIRLDDKLDITVGVPLRSAPSALAILNLRPWPHYTMSIIRDLDQSWGGEALVERRFGGRRREVDEGPIVAALEITGLPAELEAAARDHLRTRVGRRARPDVPRLDVERLAGMLRDAGYPLARVTLETTSSAELPLDDLGRRRGGIVVSFDVELDEPVAIVVEGLEPDKLLRRQLGETVQTFGLYAETEAELERVLREALEVDGYGRAFTACERRRSSRGEPLTVTCEVERGPQLELGQVQVRGAKYLSPEEIRAAVRDEARLLRPSRLITTRVDEGLQLLRGRYYRAGYRNAKLRAELDTSRDDRLGLIIHVDEGERFRVGSVVLQGVTARFAEELLPRLRSQHGSPFDEESVRLDRDQIFQRLDGEGRLDATVRAIVDEHPELGTVDLSFLVDEGELVALGEVRIRGLRRTSEKLARRLLALEPTQPLSYGRIARAQRRLYDAGVFRSVDISPVHVEGEPGKRDLEIRVEEAAPYRVELGGGFDSQDGIRGVAEIADINFLGRGRYLGLYLGGSRREGRAQLFLRQPRLFDRDSLSMLLTGFFESRQEVSFDEDRWVFRAEATHAFDHLKRNRLLARYGLSSTSLGRLQVSPLEAGTEDIQLSTLGLALVRDVRDNLLEPRHGYFVSADLEWSSQLLRSEADFAKLTLKGYRYQALSSRMVWATGAQFGISRVGSGLDRLPISERFFAGGASTLRGLSFNEAGPTDPETGFPTGGNALLVLNQELRYDLFGPIIASTFVDVGNVHRDVDELGEDLRWSVGAGLRYRAAIVAGVDYARLLDRRDGESRDQIRFSLGYAF